MDAFLRCDSVVALTARLADGTVAADRRELVEMHLLACPSCLQHVRKVQLMRSSLTALPGRHAPEHLVTLMQGTAPAGSTAGTGEGELAEGTPS
ncbi:anti-sigma factor family protein [Micromonospora sp. WMMD558]|uniref:anti-sigma factor family protein n=1 Tax=Micromonospora sp. WMMD558 TaxID=3403462 RepID=UPI003BF5F4EC